MMKDAWRVLHPAGAWAADDSSFNVLASHFIHQFLVKSAGWRCRDGRVMGRRL
jgi:hypothetical protein